MSETPSAEENGALQKVDAPEVAKQGQPTEITSRNQTVQNHADDDDIAVSGSVGALGQKFHVIARRLWAGAIVTFVLMLVVQITDLPEKQQMMWLLGVAMGGMMGTGSMHGRLADNRGELARVRAELDRKATEYSKLLSKFLKNPQSSRKPNSKRAGR